jgi:ABC-type glycerol-3-phosphate transport system substrate-binding protein
MSTFQRQFVYKVCVGVITLALFSISLISCGSSGGGSTATTSSNSPIVAWVDSTRLPGVQLYAKEHPNVKVKIVTVDRAQLPEKILLFNRAGSGWPDVVFAEPNLIARVADNAHHYPIDLTPYVSQDILNKFAPGSLAPCQIGGKLYCIRNDLAQDVLWYNAKLMKQFGYTVPTTWEQYQALGLRVAKEHPGYVIGAFGDSQALDSYFWASQCPASQLTGADTVRINLSSPNCTRVANLVDPLIQAGVLPKLGPFDADFVKLGTSDKILMMPAASWYGEYVFKPNYKTPNGELAAAPPPPWANESRAWTGAQGGSSWAVSSHTQKLKAAVDLAVWMATSTDYQATAVTFPAYLPAADAWSKTIANDPLYASDPYPVLKQSASLIWPGWSSVRYDPEGTFQQVVIVAVQHGKTVASALPTYQNQLVQLAQTNSYTVVTQ